MKRLIVIREMQIKITMRYHLLAIRLAKIKRLIIPSAAKNVRKKMLSLHSHVEVQIDSAF